MALIAKQTIGLTGAIPTYAAVNAADTFNPGSNVFLHVKNTSGATPSTVTITTPGSISGLAVAEITTVVGTASEKMIGPLPGSLVARSSDGLGDVAFSSTSLVTVAALELDPNIA